MPEYEIRVAGNLGPLAISVCPGFTVRRAVSLRGVADGDEELLRMLGAILDRRLPDVEMRIRGRDSDGRSRGSAVVAEPTSAGQHPSPGPAFGPWPDRKMTER